jgi:hypothetical protein
MNFVLCELNNPILAQMEKHILVIDSDTKELRRRPESLCRHGGGRRFPLDRRWSGVGAEDQRHFCYRWQRLESVCHRIQLLISQH